MADITSGLSIGQGMSTIDWEPSEYPLPSCFPVTDLAASTIGAATLAIAELLATEHPAPGIAVNQRLASLWFGFSIYPLGWEMPPAWDPLSGDYTTRDGWIKIHTNAPHHKAAALRVLAGEPTKERLACSALSWRSDELEQAIVDAGGCAARLRQRSEWLTHPQGLAVTREPLVLQTRCDGAPRSSAWHPQKSRPLHGVRVLDLTRVLAGPVATRFLAAYGAEVLRLDPPHWHEPSLEPEVTLGKRCARLDLQNMEDRRTFEDLLSRSDIVVHGYRSGSLEGSGYSAQVRQEIRPGLIDVSLNAYGHSGPWRSRRGFDSLVQFSTGIADEGMRWKTADNPISLPVQALDHGTGYLMAAAAIRGLIGRIRGEQTFRYELSLARTAELLFTHRESGSSAQFAPASDADRSTQSEHTAWGPAHRLKPPVTIEGTPMAWDTPAIPLGCGNPRWDERD